MCAKKKQPAKAEKRWQRHLREIEVTRREDAAILAEVGFEEDGDTGDQSDGDEDSELTERFRERVLGNDTLRKGSAVVDAKGLYGTKLSDAVIDVCQPFLDEVYGDEDAMRSAVMVGITAWNIACVANGREEAMVRRMARDMITKATSGHSKSDLDALVSALRLMIERKNERYPDMDMVVVEHELLLNGDTLQFNACGVKVGKGQADSVSGSASRRSLFGRLRERLSPG
jgi:hypothetical protein